jgi:hypothetical protein
MKNKSIVARKIKIDEIMDCLADLFDRGMDFVDLEFIIGDGKEIEDIVRIIGRDEYMSPEEEEGPPGKISDEDIEDLI